MPPQMNTSRNVLVLWPVAEWPLGDIRLRLPLASWCNNFGGHLRCIPLSAHRQEDLDWADVVVIQRESSLALLRLIRKWRAMQKAVIFDIDDLLLEVPEFLESYTHYKETAHLIEQALAAVNHVTTTTQRLATELQIFARGVSLIPNWSHHTGGVIQHTHLCDTPIKLLIASSDTVRLDFLFKALRRILDDAAYPVEILAIGKTSGFLKANNLPVTEVPLLRYIDFLDFVSQQQNAIGIIPLDNSKFSSCKSPIKYLDYSSCGIPSVCSNVHPYSDVISHEQDGVLVSNDEESWYEAIMKLINNTNQRKIIALMAESKAKSKYSILHCATDWNLAIEMAICHAKENPVDSESVLFIVFENIWHFFLLVFKLTSYHRFIEYYFKYGFFSTIKRLWKF